MPARPASLVLPLLLAAAPALADGGPAALDLRVPPSPIFNGDSPYRQDPPGTWYGDTSGDPAPVARVEPACPTAPDGSERSLTGSVTTGIGWSSRGGNSNYNAANLNFCKGFSDDDGNVRTMNFNLEIERYDGPAPWYGGRRHGRWGGGMPMR